MTTNNIDCQSNELRDEEQLLEQVTGGFRPIVKVVDKASPALLSSYGGGSPSLEYWLQQLMF